MQIDNDKLKALYQAHVGSQKPSSRKDCPSTKKLIGVLRSQASEEQATGIVDHLSHCGYCASEFRFLLEVLRNENALIRDLEQLLPSKKPEEIQSRDHGDILEPREGRTPFFPRFSWRAVLLMAGLFIVGLIISERLIFQTPERYRTESAARIKLLHPAEKTVARSSLVFKWKGVTNSEYYILRLFDKALVPIWQSDKISLNSAVLPADLTVKLQDSSSYFWMITAHLSNGQEIESPLEEFVVKE